MATRKPGRPNRRLVVASVVRLSVVTLVLFGLYARAPLGERPGSATLVDLVLSLLVFAAVVTWQIVAVTRSPYPTLQAIESAVISVPLLLLLFASAYFVTAQTQSGSFTEALSRTDALYFSVTVFATVGFGDIAALSEAARVQVTIQMVADLILIGFIARVLVSITQRRRRDLDADAGESAGPAGATDV